MSVIRSVEIIEYAYEVPDLGSFYNPYLQLREMCFEKGARARVCKYIVRIETDDGLYGDYAPQYGANAMTLAQTLALAPHLIGRDPEQREKIYNDLKVQIRHYDRCGIAALDIALWDLAGRKYGVPVSRLLGGWRTEIPAYASTYPGQPDGGGLDSVAAFADFARRCRDIGLPGYKIHGWRDGDARREAALLFAVREAVGDAMELMVDPASHLPTFLDALYVGRACDEARCLWYEDPYQDSSTSAFSHKRLREKIKTPLLLAEHVRGVEQKADFLLAGGTDILHIDLELDGGITAGLHLAHFAEALGVDVQVHTPGPAQRHYLSVVRNTMMYELGLVCPDSRPNFFQPPVYACGYEDSLEAVNSRGAVEVPTGPGLGVTYDFEKINRWTTARHVFGETPFRK